MELSGGGSLIGRGFRLSNRPFRKCVVNREQGREGGESGEREPGWEGEWVEMQFSFSHNFMQFGRRGYS